MARSVLRSLVNGTRQLLTVQLFVAIITVALAGWTLAVTNTVIRDRDRLRDRVIQLEQAMASGGMVVPATPVLVDQPVSVGDANAYPGEIGLTANGEVRGQRATEVTSNNASRARPATQDVGANFSRVLSDLFAPPPPLHVAVLHVHSEAEANAARLVAENLVRAAHVRVIINVLPVRDPHEAGYAYFDGRQSAAAAALVGQFNDAARQWEIAPWSAQLRGTALPAQGEYRSDRVDLVLPPLPPPPPPPLVATEPVPAAPSTAVPN